MDSKEKLLLEQYKKKFRNNSFEEYDIYGFLILIRNYIKQRKSKYKYLNEFCDLVAHRKRDRGIIMDSICVMIEKKYYITQKGYINDFNILDNNTWVNEWQKLSKALKLSLTNNNINEITMCIFSLVQNTKYDNKKHHGYVKLLVDMNSNIYLVCTVGNVNSKMVAFAKYKNCISNISNNKLLIKDPVLITRDKSNNLIVLEHQSYDKTLSDINKK